MRARLTVLFLMLPCTFALTACDSTKPAAGINGLGPIGPSQQVQSGPVSKPAPPLQLPVPAALASEVDGKDLKAMADEELAGRARLAASQMNYPNAAAYQYWHVQKSKDGQYDLACYLARSGKTDAAFYWLQTAALEEGVDSDHARWDEDLESLRNDSRWEQVQSFLVASNHYFATAKTGKVVVVVPKGYQKGTPIPAVVWMHGLGSRPEDFVNSGSQEFADEMNVALIGVSGTKPRGPRSFVWAVNPEEDAKRLRDALAEVADRVTIKKGCIITLGFSQGAQVGLDVAVRYPEEYAGSIVLSPGAESHLNKVRPSPLLAQRGFVVSCNAEEAFGNVALTGSDADWLKKARAQVIHKEYPGVAAHAFPEDFAERFPEWVKFILKTRGE